MSLSTRCPACQTTFRVVPDQLKISQGWVRCGQCAEVFDASQHLQPVPSPAVPDPVASAAAALAPGAITDPAPSLSASQEPHPMPSATEDTGLFSEVHAQAPVPEVDSVAAAEGTLMAPAAPGAAASLAPVVPAPGATDGGEAAAPPEWGLPPPAPAPGWAVAREVPVPLPASADDEPPLPAWLMPKSSEAPAPSGADADWTPPRPMGGAHTEDARSFAPSAPLFLEPRLDPALLPGDVPGAGEAALGEPATPALSDMAMPGAIPVANTWLDRQEPVLVDDGPTFLERPASPWRARWRALWRVLALVLLLVLVAQLLRQERDRLAASHPLARGLMQALCVPLQCTVQPWRQIESVVVDGASFSKLDGQAYRLSFTVRNSLAATLAMPAIELTLTDARDQVLLRRVLEPSELGAPALLRGGAEWSTSLPVQVGLAPEQRMASFRVLAFYPD